MAHDQAINRAADAGERGWLPGDFQVCLAECAGHSLLADILKDLTARTTLIASLHPGTHAAGERCAEHALMAAALEAGGPLCAIALLRSHTGSVGRHLGRDATADDPPARAPRPVHRSHPPTPTPTPTTTTTTTEP